MVYRDTSVTRTLNSYNSIIRSCKKLEIFFRKRMQSPSDVHPDGQVVVVVVAVTEAELLQAQPWQEGVLQVLDKEGRVKQQPDDGGIASSCRQVPGCTTAAA